MANPNIRTVTGKSTIPAGAAQAGTFTVNSGHTDRLDYSGTAAALETILGQGRFNSEQEKDNLWIYMPDENLCVRVLSWGGTVVKVDGDCTGVSAATWELVEGNLCGWSILNQGGSAGTVDGQSLADGASISFMDAPEATYRRNNLDAIMVNGSGTSFLIEEKLG